MKKQLAPPANWQDFEDLCKHLFGELWNCKYSIRKNGRLGQDQSGVDVYGMPEGKTEYWGVQCKGKDNYSHKKLTKKEIDTEIEKAKKFKPKLEVYIFATTAPKDAKIEEYVREKNQESKKSKGFEILLYDWDDLTDEIRRNKSTYNMFVLSKKFEDEHSISVTFLNDLKKITLQPNFLKTITKYECNDNTGVELKNKTHEFYSPIWMKQTPTSLFGEGKVNHSWCSFDVFIENTGNETIEDWKVKFYFDTSVMRIDDNADSPIASLINTKSYSPTYVDKSNFTILYTPYRDKPLVPKDSRSFKVFLIPVANEEVKQTTISWELLSRNFNTEGELMINLQHIYEVENKTIPDEWL